VVRANVRRLSLWFLSLLVLVHCYPLLSAEDKDKLGNTIADIQQMVLEINKELPDTITSYVKRRNLAQEVSYIIRDLKQEADIHEVVIDNIAALLGDPDHVVRSYAARALGYMGPKAIRAVPALEKALKEIEDIQESLVFGPSTSSASSIRRALGASPAKIGLQIHFGEDRCHRNR
jgi:HEAT repeat protein